MTWPMLFKEFYLQFVGAHNNNSNKSVCLDMLGYLER